MAAGHQDIVRSVAWSPDGRLLATASADQTLKLWDGGTLELKHENRPSDAALLVVVWSPDGRYLATGSVDRTVRLHDASTANVIRSCTQHKDSVLSLAWSPNGKLLASGSADRTAKIWSAERLEVCESLEGHRGSVRGVGWSPDGKTLATGSTDRTCRVWTSSVLRLWHKHRSLKKELESRPNWIRCMTWSADGKTYVTGSKDRTLSLWDSRTDERLWTQQGVADVGSQAFDKPSRMIEKKRERMDEWTRVVAWSPDQRQIAAAADDALRVFEASSGAVLQNWGGMSEVFCLAWSPDGRSLAAAMRTWIEILSDALTRPLALTGHRERVISIGWSADGARLASSSIDHSIRVWRMPNQATSRFLSEAECELEAVDCHVNSLSWSTAGCKIAGGAEDGSIFIWDATTGSLIRRLVGHGHSVTHMIWGADDQWLASSARNGEVILWLCDDSWRIINRFLAPRHPRITLDLSMQPEDIAVPTIANRELAVRSWALDISSFVNNKPSKPERVSLGRFPGPQQNVAAAIKPPANVLRQTLPIDNQPDEARKLRVFLSYAREDSTKVRDLYSRLKGDGIQPWLDEIDLKPGDEWGERIPFAVRESDIVLVCLSQHSIRKNGYLQKEIRIALDTADEKAEGIRYLIPVKLDDGPVPNRLARWQWVNLFEDSGYQRLVEALKEHRNELGLN